MYQTAGSKVPARARRSGQIQETSSQHPKTPGASASRTPLARACPISPSIQKARRTSSCSHPPHTYRTRLTQARARTRIRPTLRTTSPPPFVQWRPIRPWRCARPTRARVRPHFRRGCPHCTTLGCTHTATRPPSTSRPRPRRRTPARPRARSRRPSRHPQASSSPPSRAPSAASRARPRSARATSSRSRICRASPAQSGTLSTSCSCAGSRRPGSRARRSPLRGWARGQTWRAAGPLRAMIRSRVCPCAHGDRPSASRRLPC